MTRHHLGPVKTFSIGFSDKKYDESGYARKISAYLGTEHTELIIDPEPVVILNQIAESSDQPFADSSAIPTLLLSRLASRQVVVALSGDGGDEVFGGYERYLAAPWLQKMNPLLAILNPGLRPILGLAKRSGYRKLSRIASEIRSQPDLGSRYRGIMEYTPLHLRENLWTKSAQSHFNLGMAENDFDETWRKFHELSDLNRMRAVDFSTYLPGDLLTKVDIASMSCSLEVRSPFLDQKVLELATQLTHKAMVRGRTTKWSLRQ
jgi:asparagine synthase (glutamine-hydrolysing)